MNARPEPWDRLHLVAVMVVVAVCLAAFIVAETAGPEWKREAGIAALGSLVAYALFNLLAGWRTGLVRVRAFRARRTDKPGTWLLVMLFWTLAAIGTGVVLALNAAR
ncbi:MAG: hypothetical protein H0X45_16275 [Planctomycetes bacterium]|nr:hypothetical protein [Planctomycetota bacterium]